MTLDSIIEKYGIHELDIDLCKRQGEITTIFAYCHEHGKERFMLNHYLKIEGNIIPLDLCVEEENDIYLHVAFIEKLENNIYEIQGLGGRIRFSIEGDLSVEELTEDKYTEQTENYSKQK